MVSSSSVRSRALEKSVSHLSCPLPLALRGEGLAQHHFLVLGLVAGDKLEVHSLGLVADPIHRAPLSSKNSAEVPSVTFSLTWLMKASSIPTSVREPPKAPTAAPSAIPCGTRIAKTVSPFIRSGRSYPHLYARTVASPGRNISTSRRSLPVVTSRVISWSLVLGVRRLCPMVIQARERHTGPPDIPEGGLGKTSHHHFIRSW